MSYVITTDDSGFNHGPRWLRGIIDHAVINVPYTIWQNGHALDSAVTLRGARKVIQKDKAAHAPKEHIVEVIK